MRTAAYYLNSATIIYAPSGYVSRGAGHGFFIGRKGCFLTTYHQYRATHPNRTKIYDGHNYLDAKFIQGMPEMDLALYKIKKADKAIPVNLIPKLYIPNADEELLVVNGDGNTLKVRAAKDKNKAFGIFLVKQAYQRNNKKGLFIGYRLTRGDLKRGDSGSLVKNLKGEAIGIIFAINQKQSKNFAAAIPISQSLLKPYLDAANC